MRTEKILPNTVVLTAAICILVLAGCASTQPKKIIANEKLLAAAGFKRHPADTPAKLEQLKKMPQLKLFTRKENNSEYYIYVDAQHCQCLFEGGREEYERYQELALKNQLAADKRRNEKRERNRNLDWGQWRFRDNW